MYQEKQWWKITLSLDIESKHNIVQQIYLTRTHVPNGEGNGSPLQCSFLENPATVEPGGLPSLWSHRVGHDWSDLAAAAAAECP